jgi:hypothetical protein
MATIVTARYQVNIPQNANQTKSLVPVGEHSLAPRTGFSLCCCREEKPADYRKAALIFDKYLKQEYGEWTTRSALTRCQINLTAKQSDGTPLLVQEAQTILREADDIKQRSPILKRMIKDIVYYQQSNETLDVTLPQDKGESSSTVFELSTSAKLLIQKRNGTVTSFDEKQVQKDLEEISLATPLTASQIPELLEDVKVELHTQQLVQLSPGTIRQAVTKVLQKKNLIIKKPSILDVGQENPTLNNLLKRKRLEELKPEELDFMLEHITNTEQHTVSKYPLEVKQ